MADPIDPQTLYRLLVEFAKTQAEVSTLRVVLRAAVETHPQRDALLRRLGDLAEIREQTDLGQAVEDARIAERKADVEKWMRWIERHS